MVGYVLPNEEVYWGILIALYPMLTGIVAGSFIVSTLYYVFGIERFEKVSRLALIISIAFIVSSPLPLIADLKQPSRAFEIYLTPNLSSPMAIFGYLLVSYVLLMVVEALLIYSAFFVNKANLSAGIKRVFYRALALGRKKISEEGLKRDKRMIKGIALIGIPVASLFHAYVGFVFGSMKAGVWWATPIMPVSFLISAIVSGIALLIVAYVIAEKVSKGMVDRDLLNHAARFLGWFIILDLSFQLLEILFRSFMRYEEWLVVQEVFFNKLATSFVGIQLLFGATLPLLLLIVPSVRRSSLWVSVVSIIAIIGVFAYRWNTVIGGQLISRTAEGILEYSIPIFGRFGLVTAISILFLPLFIIMILLLIVPWKIEVKVKTIE